MKRKSRGLYWSLGPWAGVRCACVSLKHYRPLFLRVKLPGLGRGDFPARGRRGAETAEGGAELGDERRLFPQAFS